MNNLLKQALGAIGAQKVMWHRYRARVQNSRGEWIPKHSPGIEIWGSMQPADMARVKELGLDTTKQHWTLYTQADIHGVDRGRAPDYVTYAGKTMSVISVTNWHMYDGWLAVMLVEATE